MERVPPTRIDAVRWSSSLERWGIGFEVRIAGQWRDGLRLGVRLEMPGGSVVGDDTYTLTSTEVVRRIALSDPGIDDSQRIAVESVIPDPDRGAAAALGRPR